MKDITLDEDITIGHYVNVVLNGYTLDLNGHKLTVSSDKVGTTDLDGGTVQNGTIEYNIPTGSGYAGGIYRNVILNVRVSEHTFTFAGVTDGSIIMNAGKLVVKEGGQVGAVTVPSGSSTAVIDNHGQIGKLNNQSGSSVTVNGQPPEDFDGDISVDSNEWIYKSKEPQKNGSTYTITSAEELAWISQKVKAGNTFSGEAFELVSDLDLSGFQWTPIGYTPDTEKAYFFEGAFDGNGHTIKGIQIGSPSAYDDKLLSTGLFGLTGSKAVIHDVHAEAAIYTSTSYYTGGFVGLNNGSIYNCSVSGNITYDSDVNVCYGIGGFTSTVAANDVSMINCSANMQISAKLPGNFGIGGFIGVIRMVSRTSIANCYAAGSLEFIGPWDGCTVGGFIGYTMLDSTNLRNCFTTMDITAKLGPSVSGDRQDRTYAAHAFEGLFYFSSIKTAHNFTDSSVKVEITKTDTPSDIELAPSDASTSSVAALTAAELNNYWNADNLPAGFTLNDLQVWTDVSGSSFPVLK